MTLVKSYQTLLPAVEKAIGGKKVARDFLFAQAYRKMVSDGPYVWEMSREERGALALRFYKEFEEASEEDQDHMMDLVQLVASEMNEMMGPRIKPPKIVVGGLDSVASKVVAEAAQQAFIAIRNNKPKGAKTPAVTKARKARKLEAEVDDYRVMPSSTWKLHVYARRAAQENMSARVQFLKRWRATHSPEQLTAWVASADTLLKVHADLFEQYGTAVEVWQAKTAAKTNKSE